MAALLVALTFVAFAGSVYSAGVRYGQHLAREAYFENVVRAIYQVEGGKAAAFPFGVVSVDCDGYAECRRIALNTIRNNWRRWENAGRPGNFIDYLAMRYCPVRWSWWSKAVRQRLA